MQTINKWNDSQLVRKKRIHRIKRFEENLFYNANTEFNESEQMKKDLDLKNMFEHWIIAIIFAVKIEMVI